MPRKFEADLIDLKGIIKMSNYCEVAFSIKHNMDVHFLSGDYGKLHELRKRLSRHKHTCPICGDFSLARNLFGTNVAMMAADE